jgi:hypothetical protein
LLKSQKDSTNGSISRLTKTSTMAPTNSASRKRLLRGEPGLVQGRALDQREVPAIGFPGEVEQVAQYRSGKSSPMIPSKPMRHWVPGMRKPSSRRRTKRSAHAGTFSGASAMLVS